MLINQAGAAGAREKPLTVIAAIHLDGETWIGSDTMAVNNDAPVVCGPKWVVGQEWAIGVAGVHRTQNIIEARCRSALNDREASIGAVCGEIRTALLDDGYEPDKEPVPTFSGSFLVAHREGVWSVDSQFSFVAIPLSRCGAFWASGCGRDHALGAFHALIKAWQHVSLPKLTGCELVAHAIDAAIAGDVYCGGTAWVSKL